jgi:hypothetical protein
VNKVKNIDKRKDKAEGGKDMNEITKLVEEMNEEIKLVKCKTRHTEDDNESGRPCKDDFK